MRAVIERHMHVLTARGLRPAVRAYEREFKEASVVESDEVGVFFLHSQFRPFVEGFWQFAKVLRVFRHRFPEEARRVRVHVMTTGAPGKEGRDREMEEDWREAMGAARDMLEGVFKVGAGGTYR